MVQVLVGAIVGAIVTYLLTRFFTPDASAQVQALRTEVSTEVSGLRGEVRTEVSGLREQIAAFQQHIQTLEQERAEFENFPLEMTLQQAVSQNYILQVKNDSDNEVTIETVSLERDGVSLSEANKPRPTDDWKIPPHSGKPIFWAPQYDPTLTMQYKEPNLGSNTPVPIAIVATCSVRGKTIIKRRTHLVTVDFRNRRMTTFGP